jgi:outer membrane protein assembly factor BamB
MIYLTDDVADFSPSAGRITALSVHDGVVRWRSVFDGAPGLALQYVSGDAVIAYAPIPQSVTSTGGVYFRLDVRDGSPDWTLRNAERGAPVFTPTAVYLGNPKRLTAYDIGDLTVRWTAAVPGASATPVLLSEQYIGVRTPTSFEVYEASSGKHLWGRDQPAMFGIVRLAGSTLCASANASPGSVSGFDIATGERRWSYQSTEELQYSMPLDGVSVYVRTFAAVFSFNPKTGAVRWRTPLDAKLDVEMDVTPA